MSLNSKESKNKNNNNETKKEKEKEDLICPNAPIITKKPEMKKIPYINVIEDNDSSSSQDQKEKPTSIAIGHKKDMDDRYNDEDSFDNGFIAEQETKSESLNNKKVLKKIQEGNLESFS